MQENHHHTDENPAVISATEARGAKPNKDLRQILLWSTLLVTVLMFGTFFLFLR